MTNEEILNHEYTNRDHGLITIKHYFYMLLFELWKEGEGFSGKRPFGNSGWEHDIYEILVDCGAVKGKFEYDSETGECYGLENVDKVAANKLTFDLIDHVFGKSY